MVKNDKCHPGKNILKWILSIFMFVSCLVFKFSVSSIIFALLGIYFLPLAPIQNFFNTFMPKKKILCGTIAFAIFISGCNLIPQAEAPTPLSPEPPSITVSNELLSNPTTEVPTDTPTEAPTTAPTAAPTESPTEASATPPVDSNFNIHFIDVGQADAALILCDGKAMLIDGGNAEDSNLLYTYLKKHGITHLDYVIGTHAHEDHIGGLAGALSYASVSTALCPTNSYDTKAFTNFVKALSKHGVAITIPSTGDSFTLGSAICTVLSVNADKADPNNSSIVLRIVYGETSFLFTGDAERQTEQAIIDSNAYIHSTVLKVGHHGSNSSTSYIWLREVMPQYAIISVSKDNSYGHPTEEVLSRLRDAEVKTFRTDLQGDILCTSDGKTVSFTVTRNKDADVFNGIGSNSTQPTNPPTVPPTNPPTQPPTNPPTQPPVSGQDYTVNTNTGKFHYPYCASAKSIKDSNRWDYHGTRDYLINAGYIPCKKCTP
jgi:competence protein ComEC